MTPTITPSEAAARLGVSEHTLRTVAREIGACSIIGKAPVFGYGAAQNVKQVWDHAVTRAGIERLTPHSCRHGFATAMLRAGYDVKTVANLGGWQDAATVLRYYAHAMDDLTLTEAVFAPVPAFVPLALQGLGWVGTKKEDN